MDRLKPAIVNSFIVLGAIVTKMALLRGSVLKGFTIRDFEYEILSKIERADTSQSGTPNYGQGPPGAVA